MTDLELAVLHLSRWLDRHNIDRREMTFRVAFKDRRAAYNGVMAAKSEMSQHAMIEDLRLDGSMRMHGVKIEFVPV